MNAAFVVVGQIGAPYGVQGWHHVRSFTSPQKNILNYKQWLIEQKGQWVSFDLLAGRVHGKSIVAQLEGSINRDIAASFTLSKIAVLRSQLPQLEENEFYWTDLEGLSVLSTTGNVLGKVSYLYDNAGLDVMVIACQDKEHHLPFIMHDTVVAVDLSQNQMIVDWDFTEEASVGD